MSAETLYKKVVVSVKDATGAFVKQERYVPAEPAAPAAPPWVEPQIGDISLDDLLSRCLRTLWREVRLLEMATHGGAKLTPIQADQLRDNTKLLMDLKKREKDLLDGLSDEELEELSRKKKSHDFAEGSGARSRPSRKKKKGSEEI